MNGPIGKSVSRIEKYQKLRKAAGAGDTLAILAVDRDIMAFRYLYDFANLNIIKKIESSEITRSTLSRFHQAMEELEFVNQIAVVPMGMVQKPDTLVQVADFFLKIAEATWSITSGIYDRRLIVIFRNAGFRRNAGKMARKLFGKVGSAGGHAHSARAEVPLENIDCGSGNGKDCRRYVLRQIRKMSGTDN